MQDYAVLILDYSEDICLISEQVTEMDMYIWMIQG